MKNRKILLTLISLLFMLFFQNCTNDELEFNVKTGDEVFSENEKELLMKMDEASKVLAQMVRKDVVNEEIGMLIEKRMYRDDYIFFKDLFEPIQNTTLKSAGISKTIFEVEFDNILKKDNLKSSEIEGLKEYLIANNLTLYVPYPIADYDRDNRIPTVSFHPLLNDSVNVGYEPIDDEKYKSVSNSLYNEVLVDEQYSLNRPVYLIIPIEEEYVASGNTNASSTTYPVDISKDNIAIELEKYYVANKHQYDGIFSGGSEFRVVRVSLNKLSDHNFMPDDDFIDCYASRKAIRKGTEIPCGTVLKTDWKKSELSIVVGAYEYDPGDWAIHNGRIGLTYKLINSGQATINWGEPEGQIQLVDTLTAQQGIDLNATFKFRIENEDGLLGQQTWGRDWIGTWKDGEKFYSFGDLKCTFKAVSYDSSH